VRNRRNQWAAVFILHLALSALGASQEQNTTVPVIPRTIHAPQIFAKAGLLRDEMSRIGLTFQGLYVNDWTFGSDGNEQDRWFGRYSFDFFLNVDGEKLVGWRGASASLRLKQHLPQFGDENSYSRVSQLYSNIDGNSRTSIYELWLQQTTLSNKLRVKVGKVDASSEFATVAIAADFLNASMGFSPTVMYFPTYPEPKPGIMSFVYPNDRYFVGAGVFRTNGDGTLSIAEGGTLLAKLARNSKRFVHHARIRRSNIRERSRAPCFRKICFSGATENVVAQAAGSRRRADVRLGFHRVRGTA